MDESVLPLLLVTLAVTATAMIALCLAAALRAWNQWLELKRLQQCHSTAASPARAQILELRQRIRRLESIADGEV